MVSRYGRRVEHLPVTSPAGITSDCVTQFTVARSGLAATLALGQMKGIIPFPSCHAAAEVLFGYAFTS